MDDPLLALAAGMGDGVMMDQDADPLKLLAEEAEQQALPAAPAALPCNEKRPPRRQEAVPGVIPVSRFSLTAQQAEAAATERRHQISAFRRAPQQQARSTSAPRPFKDMGQGSLVERHSGLKVTRRRRRCIPAAELHPDPAPTPPALLRCYQSRR